MSVIEAAHLMGLVPLVCVLAMHARGRRPWPEHWWLALMFAVSWVADSATHYGVSAWLVALLYPITQAGMVAAWYGTARRALGVIGVLVAVAVLAAVISRVQGPDVLLTVMAFGTAAAFAWRSARGIVRWSLLTTFGLGAALWCWYAWRPDWWSWGGFQVARALGILLFCLGVVGRDRG